MKFTKIFFKALYLIAIFCLIYFESIRVRNLGFGDVILAFGLIESVKSFLKLKIKEGFAYALLAPISGIFGLIKYLTSVLNLILDILKYFKDRREEKYMEEMEALEARYIANGSIDYIAEIKRMSAAKDAASEANI